MKYLSSLPKDKKYERSKNLNQPLDESLCDFESSIQKEDEFVGKILSRDFILILLRL